MSALRFHSPRILALSSLLAVAGSCGACAADGAAQAAERSVGHPTTAAAKVDPRARAADLAYAPSPADNPLRGLVPYATADALHQFPHSLEFDYFPLAELMRGPGEFQWEALEASLAATGERGCQMVLRIYLEYPGRPIAIPEHLLRGGLEVTRWSSDDNGGGESATPDYSDPKLRAALSEFIAAFGARYDGDPRIGYITAGLLGSWGEWHTYPREDLWPSKEVQLEVMDSYERAFQRTPILLRYPAGDDNDEYAPNAKRRFGYHDDSFGWATLETKRAEDSWYFMPSLKAAGALEAWKTRPIGGEIRPELWPASFTAVPHPKGQDFARCIEATHATWLMDSGLFSEEFAVSLKRRERALAEVARMGYSLSVTRVELDRETRVMDLLVENRGVAPFYADWPVELAAFRGGQRIDAMQPEGWDLRGVEARNKPKDRQPSTTWRATLPGEWAGAELRVRVPNPMPSGRPLRFANREQAGEWLVLPLVL
ncbi:MAG: DUF4832 domain-containing protein [Planctomycetota bacterium]